MNIQWLKNIVEKITVALHITKLNSPTVKISQKTQHKIGQVNIHQGLSYSEAKDLIVSVVDQKLITFKDEAEELYKKRANEFATLLTEKIKDLPNDEIVKLKEPDTQLALIEAAKISGRKQNEEIRNILANLVVNRIKNDKTGQEELKNIVYNEAIATVGKLTIDQLKIVTLCYLLKYTSYHKIVSWESFNEYLNQFIKPFINFNNTNAEFQHIEYAGCGSIGIGSWDLIKIYRTQQSFLFLNLIEKSVIDSLEIPDELKKEMVLLDQKENKYLIRFRNKTELENYLREKSSDKGLNNKITNLYESNLKNNNDVKSKIINETDLGKEIVALVETSSIKHLNLTSVGIAIGATYFEQTVGEKIDIDIWIH